MPVEKKSININLEVLRGFSALIVVVSHIFFCHHDFNSAFFPQYLARFEPPGHFAVLIFFVLSGFVIGSAHKTQLKGNGIWLYLKKRFVRIYPIYIIAICLGLMVTVKSYPLATILTNFTLTQNIFTSTMWANGPAWSLNYEIVFYLLFIPISVFNIRPLYAFLFFLTFGAITVFTPTAPIITAYSFGFSFWLMGVVLAQNFADAQFKAVKFLSAFFYILALENIIGKKSYFSITQLVSKFKVPPVKVANWEQFGITLNDLIFIPYCFMLILFVAGKELKYKKTLFLLLQLLPLFIIYTTFKHHVAATIDPAFYVATISLALSALFYAVNWGKPLIGRFGYQLGSVSYGLYITHFQVLILFGRLALFPDGLAGYILRVIIYLITALALAWLLEKKIQPRIRALFFSSPVKTIPVTKLDGKAFFRLQ